MATSLATDTLFLAADIKGGFFKHLTTVQRRDEGANITLCGQPGAETLRAASGVSRAVLADIVTDCVEAGLPFCPACSSRVSDTVR